MLSKLGIDTTDLDLTAIVTAIVALVSLYISIKRSETEKTKTLAETRKLDEETKKVRTDERKVEVEVAEKLITSAGDLIQSYKDMLEELSERYGALDNKLNLMQVAFEEETKKRQRLSTVTKHLYVGVNKLVKQIEAENLIPAWKPEVELERILNEHMEDK